MRLSVIAILMTLTVLSFASCGYNRNETETSQNNRMSSGNDNGTAHHRQPLNTAEQLAKTIPHYKTNGITKKSSNRLYYRDNVMVLMYHNVKVHSEYASMITIKKLDEQLSAMKKNGFQIITMDQYMDFILLNKPVPDNAVLLTFDDGYESFYNTVFPLLRKHGVTATNFVVVSSIDDPNHRGNTKLTWNQMREMKKEGMSFYNHTYNSHVYAPVDPKGIRRPRPILARRVFLKRFNRMETKQEYETRVLNDLAKAETRLKEELGNTRSALAFPYGVYSYKALKIAHKLGIEVTFTIRPGINTYGQRNGFRINAGNQRLKTSELIKMLQNRGIR